MSLRNRITRLERSCRDMQGNSTDSVRSLERTSEQICIARAQLLELGIRDTQIDVVLNEFKQVAERIRAGEIANDMTAVVRVMSLAALEILTAMRRRIFKLPPRPPAGMQGSAGRKKR